MLERTTDVSIFWSRAIERTFSARQTSRASSSFPSKKNLTKDQKKYSPDTHGHILLLPTRSNNQQGSRCLKRSSQRLGTTAPQRASKAGANKPRLDMALCIVQTLRVFCALCPRVENNGQNCVNTHSLSMCDRRTWCIVQQRFEDNSKHILRLSRFTSTKKTHVSLLRVFLEVGRKCPWVLSSVTDATNFVAQRIGVNLQNFPVPGTVFVVESSLLTRALVFSLYTHDWRLRIVDGSMNGHLSCTHLGGVFSSTVNATHAVRGFHTWSTHYTALLCSLMR